MSTRLNQILKDLITRGNKEKQIRYRQLGRGLNLIYTPAADETGPATLRLSRDPKLKANSDGPPYPVTVYPSDKEVAIVKGSLERFIGMAATASLEVSDPREIEKKGKKFGSIIITWYWVDQGELSL